MKVSRDAKRPATRLSLVPAEPDRRELLARFYRALGDQARLALLAFCADRERTGSECVACCGLSQGRVSVHLACLVNCGLLQVRRSGRFAYYRVVDERVLRLVALASSIVADHAAGVAACSKVAPSTETDEGPAARRAAGNRSS